MALRIFRVGGGQVYAVSLSLGSCDMKTELAAIGKPSVAFYPDESHHAVNQRCLHDYERLYACVLRGDGIDAVLNKVFWAEVSAWPTGTYPYLYGKVVAEHNTGTLIPAKKIMSMCIDLLHWIALETYPKQYGNTAQWSIS